MIFEQITTGGRQSYLTGCEETRVAALIDPELKVFPAHDYKARKHSTIGVELTANPRLQVRERGAFVAMI